MKKVVKFSQYVEVEIDEKKFDDEFCKAFNRYFFDASKYAENREEELDEHIKHLAQLNARGIYDDTDFIEGYGPAKEMGIKFDILDTEGEIDEDWD